MSLLFVDGFDAQDYLIKWDVANNSSLQTTTPYGVGRSIEPSLTAGIRKHIPASSTVYVGAAVYVSNTSLSVNSSNPGLFQLYGDNGSTVHLILRPNTATTMGLFRGTTLIGTDFAFPARTWKYVELYAKIDDVVGEYTVRVDGQVVLNATGVDTRNGGTSTDISSVLLGCAYFCDAYIDNFYISDSEFLGEINVQTLVPTAAGSSTQLTPNGGANYANVADVPDVTTTNNSSSTIGHKDLYTLGDLASSTATVKAVQVNNHARKTDVGSIGMRNVVKSGATTANGATKSLSASTTWTGDVLETDPDTSAAWTATAVNSLEAGAEVA